MSFSGDLDAAKRSERWLGKDSSRVINIRCEDSVEIYENIEQVFTSHNLRVIVCGFEKELASADINDRFVVARFGVETIGWRSRRFSSLLASDRSELSEELYLPIR